MPLPPQAATLTPFELPEVGGDTMWASMYAAWEGLSSHYQRLLDGLEAKHSTTRLRFLKEPDRGPPGRLPRPGHWPQFLFVNANYTECIVGMSSGESEALLDCCSPNHTPISTSGDPGDWAPWRCGK